MSLLRPGVINNTNQTKSLFQAQAGWSQHDYGHLSVFPKSWQNHLAHQFVIGHLKVCGFCLLRFQTIHVQGKVVATDSKL